MTLITLGVGNYLGTLFSGWLKDHYTTITPDPVHIGQTISTVYWPSVFMVPALLTFLCGIAFWFTFKEPPPALTVTDDLEAEELNTLSRTEP